MDKISKAEKNRQEDAAMTRALAWFAGAMVVEFLLLLINKHYINFSAESASISLALAINKVLKILAVVATAGGIACAVLCAARSRQRKQLQFGLLFAGVFALILGLGGASIVYFWSSAVRVLMIAIPAMAVLALIYYLYQKEFFFSALAVAIGLLGLWLTRRNVAGHPVLFIAYEVLAALALAGIAVFALRLKKNGGVLTCMGKKTPVFAKGSDVTLIIASCALSFAAGIAGAVFGAAAAFYLMLVLAAWTFVLLVYYTVKLM